MKWTQYQEHDKNLKSFYKTSLQSTYTRLENFKNTTDVVPIDAGGKVDLTLGELINSLQAFSNVGGTWT